MSSAVERRGRRNPWPTLNLPIRRATESVTPTTFAVTPFHHTLQAMTLPLLVGDRASHRRRVNDQAPSRPLLSWAGNIFFVKWGLTEFL